MGLRLIERKFKALEEEERKIYDYFDLNKKHSNQHPWLDEMRNDYKKDLENFGEFFSGWLKFGLQSASKVRSDSVAFPRFNLKRNKIRTNFRVNVLS